MFLLNSFTKDNIQKINVRRIELFKNNHVTCCDVSHQYYYSKREKV